MDEKVLEGVGGMGIVLRKQSVVVAVVVVVGSEYGDEVVSFEVRQLDQGKCSQSYLDWKSHQESYPDPELLGSFEH